MTRPRSDTIAPRPGAAVPPVPSPQTIPPTSVPARPTAAVPPESSQASDSFFGFLGKKKLTAAQKQQQKSQKAAREAVEKAQKDERARVEKAATASRDQVEYDDRLARMRSALGDLETQKPATQKLIAAMKKAMAAAETILNADPQAFSKAYKALHSADFSLHKIDEQASSAAKAADKAGRKAHPDAYRVADEIARQLTEASALNQSRIDAIEGERRAHVAYLEKESSTANGATVVQGKLSSLLTKLLGDISTAQAYRAQISNKQHQAQALFEQASMIGTTRESAPMQAKLNSAASAIAERDYAAADATLELVTEDARTLIDTQGRYHAAWIAERDSVPALRQQVRDAAKRMGSTADGRMGETASELGRLGYDLDRVVEQFPKGDDARAPGDLSYRDAVGIVEQTKIDLAAINTRIDQHAAFAGARALAQRQKSREFITERVRIEDLESSIAALGEGVDPASVVQPFREQLARIKLEWERRATNAHDHASLDAQATTDALAAFAKRVDAASTPTGAATAVADAKVDAAANACFTAMVASRAAVEQFASYDVVLAQPLVAELSAIEKRVATRSSESQYAQAANEAQVLAARARATVVMLERQAADAQAALQRATNAIAARLDILWKGIEGIHDTERRHAYTALHETFTAALDSLRGLGRVQQVELLYEAQADARVLDTNVADAVGEFEKSKGDAVLSAITAGKYGRGVNTATLDDVNRKVANQKTRLKDPELRAFAGDAAVALDLKLDTITKAIGGVTMAELVARVAQIATEIDAAWVIAERERERYDAFKKDLVETARLLSDPAFAYAPKTKAGMEATLAELRAEARGQGGVTKALPQLANMRRQMRDAIDSVPNAGGVPTLLAASEQDFQDAENKKVAERKSWEGHVAVLKKRLGDLPTHLSDDRKALASRLAAADKAYGNNGDFSAAWAQLSAVRKRMEMLTQNPEGLMMHARGQLPSVNQRWIAAVGRLKDGLSRLASDLTAVDDDPDLTAATKKLVNDELTAVRGLFNVASFQKAVMAITRAGADAKAQAAAREQALREVRRMREIVRNDQRLRLLAQRAPLGQSFAGELSEASLALADMETNLLVSL